MRQLRNIFAVVQLFVLQLEVHGNPTVKMGTSALHRDRDLRLLKEIKSCKSNVD